MCFSYFHYHAMMWDLDKEMLCHERVGSWMVVNMWWYERGGSYLDTLAWGYEQGGSYVPCSQLRDAASGEVHSWWIMCVGLRVGRFIEARLRAGRFVETRLWVGRFVEAGPRASRFVGASYILSPWSTICVNWRLKNLGKLSSWPRVN